jgi:alpha-glucosidase
MRIPDDYTEWNVEEQSDRSDSVLSFWKQMLALRKDLDNDLVSYRADNQDELRHQIYGSFELLFPDDERIFAYLRAGSILVLLNFSEEVVAVRAGGYQLAKVLVATRSDAAVADNGVIVLQPYSGIVHTIVWQ